jgi:hypothetical protein
MSRWDTLKAIFGHKPTFLIAVGFAYAALAFWRDEGLENHQPPRLVEFVLGLPWWVGIMCSLAVLLLITFEHAHRLTNARFVEGQAVPHIASSISSESRRPYFAGNHGDAYPGSSFTAWYWNEPERMDESAVARRVVAHLTYMDESETVLSRDSRWGDVDLDVNGVPHPVMLMAKQFQTQDSTTKIARRGDVEWPSGVRGELPVRDSYLVRVELRGVNLNQAWLYRIRNIDGENPLELEELDVRDKSLVLHRFSVQQLSERTSE